MAHRPQNHRLRAAARAALKYPVVELTGAQALAVARGFAAITRRLGFVVHACAILPDHVHLVVARHAMPIEEIAEHLKRAGTRRLTADDLHPLERYRDDEGRAPTPWAEKGWYVYLDRHEDIVRSIRYTNDNPTKAGLKRQHWRFVAPYPV